MITLTATHIRAAKRDLDLICAQLENCQPSRWNDSAALAFERQRCDALALARELRSQLYTLAIEVG